MISINDTYNLSKESLRMRQVDYREIFSLESGSLHATYGPETGNVFTKKDPDRLIILLSRLTANGIDYKMTKYGSNFMISFGFDVGKGDNLRCSSTDSYDVDFYVKVDPLKDMYNPKESVPVWWSNSSKYGTEWVVTAAKR